MDLTLVENLTTREREVLTLIAEGYSAEAIAEKLHRSPKTIQTHRQALGRKLMVSNKVELTRFAIAAGLVTVSVDGQTASFPDLHKQASAGKTRHEGAATDRSRIHDPCRR